MSHGKHHKKPELYEMALLVFVGFILYMLITGGVKRDRIVTKDTVKKVEKP